MSRRIIGVTVGTPLPKPNWEQNNPKKGDYIKNKPKALNGEDGITPHIGANGNWWIGEEDTGVRAEGEQGPQGVSGVYVGSGEMPAGYNIQIDPNGETTAFVQTVNGVKPDENGNVEVAGGGGISVNTAEVGQTIRVKSVDENNKPTEWEAVDFPAGGGSSNVFHFTTEVPVDSRIYEIELPTTFENIIEFNIHFTFGTVEQDFEVIAYYGGYAITLGTIKVASVVSGERYGLNVHAMRYCDNWFSHNFASSPYYYAVTPGFGSGRCQPKDMNSNIISLATRNSEQFYPAGTEIEIWGLCK